MEATSRSEELVNLHLAHARLRLDFLLLQRDRLWARSRWARKYRPDQPRVPAGNADGGQWTSGDGGGGGWAPFLGGPFWTGTNPIDPARDNPPANAVSPAAFDIPIGIDTDAPAEFVSGRPRAPGSWPGASPAQQARLAASELQAQAAIRRVQEIDAAWKPRASLSEGIEGAILSNQAAVRQAEARYRELQTEKRLPGPFAAGSVLLEGQGKRLTASEQREINRIGAVSGCHSCGTTTPGTVSGNFVGDHHRPTAINAPGTPQRAYPQCLHCSGSQGGHLSHYLRSRR